MDLKVCRIVNVGCPNILETIRVLSDEQIELILNLEIGLGIQDLGWTQEQLEAVKRKYVIRPDGADNFNEFLQRWHVSSDGAVMGNWANMVVGIEKDGYAHT